MNKQPLTTQRLKALQRPGRYEAARLVIAGNNSEKMMQIGGFRNNKLMPNTEPLGGSFCFWPRDLSDRSGLPF